MTDHYDKQREEQAERARNRPKLTQEQKEEMARIALKLVDDPSYALRQDAYRDPAETVKFESEKGKK